MMMYDSLLARSFSKQEQRKLGYGALVACFMLALSICTVFKPYLGPLSVLNLKLSIEDSEELMIVNETRSNSLSMPVVSETVTANISIVPSSTIPEKIPRSEEPDVKNGTKNSNDTTSSDKIIDNLKPVIIEDAPVVNKTSGSERAGGSVIQNPVINNNRSEPQDVSDGGDNVTSKKMEIVCDTGRSDFCDVKGDIRIDPSSSTVYVLASETEKSAAGNRTSWNIRPYARQGDKVAMGLVKEWTVKIVTPQETNLQCTQTHGAPAVMFSSGGYSGNHFHSFTDLIIPLFATAWPFNQDVELLITNRISHWVAKFEMLLKSLSKHEFVDIDKAQGIHCYQRMVIGLKGRWKMPNKELTIDTSSSVYSIKDFRQFLRNAYSLKKQTAIQITNAKKRPRLLIVSRKHSRSFTNVAEIVRMAKSVGYKVIVAEPNADLLKSAQIMNSCDVMMGVHGAGLTNMVFMPENAVLIQIVPFGGAEWVSRTYFEEPSKDMNIRYLDYKIKLEESTLIEQYSLNDTVITHPYDVQKHGWLAFKEIYFDKQNVKLDVIRFRPTLEKALELLHK